MTYNSEIKSLAISNLTNKILGLSNTNIVLSSQGFIVNDTKLVKLSWLNLLLNAYSNITIFTKEQQEGINRLYNNIQSNGQS